MSRQQCPWKAARSTHLPLGTCNRCSSSVSRFCSCLSTRPLPRTTATATSRGAAATTFSGTAITRIRTAFCSLTKTDLSFAGHCPGVAMSSGRKVRCVPRRLKLHRHPRRFRIPAFSLCCTVNIPTLRCAFAISLASTMFRMHTMPQLFAPPVSLSPSLPDLHFITNCQCAVPPAKWLHRCSAIFVVAEWCRAAGLGHVDMSSFENAIRWLSTMRMHPLIVVTLPLLCSL